MQRHFGPSNIIFFILCIALVNIIPTTGSTTEDLESWTGRWFPEEPEMFPKHEAISQKYGTKGTIGEMGKISQDCDDGKTNLTMDWNGAYEDYICMNPRNRFLPNPTIHAKIEFENIPKLYTAPHFCMRKSIEYRSPLPTFGPHRPLWPKYGEYKYVPKQRWIHSLEHGGIVAVYHPCADLKEIKKLKALVKGCLRRHVITPSSDLTRERPFAILAWGVRFTMPYVNANEVRNFITEHALRGPEKLPDEGQYDYLLLREAKIVSDFDDTTLCP